MYNLLYNASIKPFIFLADQIFVIFHWYFLQFVFDEEVRIFGIGCHQPNLQLNVQNVQF